MFSVTHTRSGRTIAICRTLESATELLEEALNRGINWKLGFGRLNSKDTQHKLFGLELIEGVSLAMWIRCHAEAHNYRRLEL
jgi:hypothetical protein